MGHWRISGSFSSGSSEWNTGGESATILSKVELGIYAALTVPTLYVAVKHGRRGLPGWLFLLLFCALRVTGGAMSIAKLPSAVIVSSIGLSPLLLAIAGVYHEASYYLRTSKASPWVARGIVFFHVLVATGVAILAAGVSGLQSASPSSVDRTLVIVGLSIFTAAWFMLSLCIRDKFWTKTANVEKNVVSQQAMVLLAAVTASVIVTGVHVLATLIAFIMKKPILDPTKIDLTLRVLLSFLPDLVAVISLLVGGIMRRNLKKMLKQKVQTDTAG